MTYAWARWLAPALRSNPRLASRVVEIPGWETHGRPPSQFSFLPSGILGHHTACGIRHGHDPQSCVNGIRAGHSGTPGPIAQLLGTFTPLGVPWRGDNLDPRIVIIAAGRSNHAGAGEYPWGAPSGNGSSIGVEWCGPPPDGIDWPDAMVEFRAEVESTLLRWNGWSTRHYTTHYHYARPLGRKIDQSGPWRDEPTLRRTQPWGLEAWRSRLDALLAPIPTPPIEGDTMQQLIYRVRRGDREFTGFSYGEMLGWQRNGAVAALDAKTIAAATELHDFADEFNREHGTTISAFEVLLWVIESRPTTTAPPPVVRSEPSLLRAWRDSALTDAARS